MNKIYLESATPINKLKLKLQKDHSGYRHVPYQSNTESSLKRGRGRPRKIEHDGK